jgi:hypothetical protein
VKMATGQRMPKKIDDEREFFPSRRAELCPSTAVFRIKYHVYAQSGKSQDLRD